ncbi:MULTISPECIES: WXG100 family type VII secretion target [unclassified Streptomyces]|uniref:WXG100 family type VII secretion target n=1 Tax=unclassified Streptomyces TaxID=2593676 RepID=UPI00278BEC6E|nr:MULTISPECIES: type VII secretion target [unclassified Streptomyces]
MSSLPGTFRVDAEELGGFAGRLDECTSEMRAAGTRMERASVAGMGHEAVEGACGGFRESWQYGIKQLSQLTEAIRDGLRVTAQAYSDTDQAIQQAMTPAAAGASAPGSADRAASSPFG